MELNKVYNVDCLEGMQLLPAKSVDLILCDLPYGTTACKWDVVIPFEPLWQQYERLIKDNGAIVLTAAQPFTADLIYSNRKLYKYCWYWNKKSVTGFANAKKQPLRHIEEVLVFYKNRPVYNPQGLIKYNKQSKNGRTAGGESLRGDDKGKLRTFNAQYIQEFTNYPKQLLEFPRECGLHPTQKPVALFEYMIKTYCSKGATVLDNCAGSGTTAIACMNSGCNYILMEKDEKYFYDILDRIQKHTAQLKAA